MNLVTNDCLMYILKLQQPFLFPQLSNQILWQQFLENDNYSSAWSIFTLPITMVLQCQILVLHLKYSFWPQRSLIKRQKRKALSIRRIGVQEGIKDCFNCVIWSYLCSYSMLIPLTVFLLYEWFI